MASSAATVPADALAKLGDPHWRLNNLYKIEDKAGEVIPFRMNWAQEQLYRDRWYLNCVLKARQLGFTTFIDLFLLDACVFYPNVQAGIIAHNLEDAKTIFKEKVREPYERLPQEIRDHCPAVSDSANTISFANGSSLRVATSMRSGTVQYLHVSEYGKIAAKNPDKAKEIRTGAFNAVAAGQWIFVESTAEGTGGDFYDMCQTAQGIQARGEKLTKLDFRFHFYPWWKHPDYRLDPDGVTISSENLEYFEELSLEQGIELDAGQRAWYVKKSEQQKSDMKQEYPSTPDEAFEASLEGAYYAKHMALADKQRRIGSVPYNPDLPVDTWWDLGMRDSTAIWFVQRHGPHFRVIDYYENSGEGLGHYAKVLAERKADLGYGYRQHVAPHDIKVRELGTGKSRKDIAASQYGLKFSVCPDHKVQDGIEAVRSNLGNCWFDKERCSQGISALRNYRKEWDDRLAVWKTQPRHDHWSHGADAFRTGVVGGRGHHDWSGGPLYSEIGTIV